MSEWSTANAQWREWLDEDVSLAPIPIIDDFDRELRGVLDGMFGPALEATSVEMPRAALGRGLREDSMTTLIRHRDDVAAPAPVPEEFDAASTLVHAPRVDGGFDVALTTPGGGYEVELRDTQPPPSTDDAFFIPALTESARIDVAEAPADTGTTAAPEPLRASEVDDAAPELVAIATPEPAAPLVTPTITVPEGLHVDPMALTAREAVRGPIGWADAPEAAPPVRTGTTLVPTGDPSAASSQTAGVIVAQGGEDPPMPPPRRKSKIVVQTDDAASDVAAQAYDDSGEFPRPVPPLEPVDETELEDDDLDSADDIDAPSRPPTPKPAVRVIANDAPPPPPKAEIHAKSEGPPPPPTSPSREVPRADSPPPPPPRADAPPPPPVRSEGPPPPPPKTEKSEGPPPPPRAEPPPPPRPEPAKSEGPPPPPVEPARASEAMHASEAIASPTTAEPPPRVRTLPGVSGPHWSEAVFTDHFFALVRPGGPRIAATEVALLQEALALGSGSTVIDVGCGDGWHAQLLAERGMRVVGLDSSEAMIRRATELADQNGVRVRWILGDVRQRPIQEQFDAVLCLGTSFGYDDDTTNRRMVSAMRDLVRVGGRLALHVLNRDYVVPRLPARSWWQGDRCLVLDEVDMQDWTSRIRVRRTIVFEDGGQFEHTLSIRAYALHELIALVEEQGLRVVEVSGSPHTRGRFYGATSPDIWLIAERIDDR